MQWYYANQEQRLGPVDDSALDGLVAAGVVGDQTLVWREGMQDWQRYDSVRPSRVSNSVSAVPSVSSVPSVPPVAANETRYCSQCGRPFASNELVSIGAVPVCAACKPSYLQRLREGPDPAAGRLHYGGFWIRFVARIVDIILITIALLPVRMLMGIGMFMPGRTVGPAALGAALPAFLFSSLISQVAQACYEISFVAWRGATIGKMLFGLKVIRSDGSRISTGYSVARYFSLFISSFTLGIGYIMAGFDDQKRALHDRICETRVVYSHSTQ